MNSSASLCIDAWKLKLTERSRNRMKIQIKMGTEETQAFNNFMSELRPDHVSVDDFVRTLFYKGIEKFQEELFEKMQTYMEEHKDEIDASALQEMGDAASSMQGAKVQTHEKALEQNIEVIED
tara:strand:+ start:174 stop:542 length:369 start_codon:yes stop_codon:yes gene_type:complete